MSRRPLRQAVSPKKRAGNTGEHGYGQNYPYMQCRGSRRAFTTIEERNGLMPGNMIGQPYLETALPAKFLQYDIASTVPGTGNT